MYPSYNSYYAEHRELTIKAITCEKREGATHWSTWTLAAKSVVNPGFVSRVWSASSLKPHRVKSIKGSNDPDFKGKLTNVVSLYLNPPEKIRVFCVDEKSSIQALDCTWHVTFDFTLTSSSCLNQVERSFGLITEKFMRYVKFSEVLEG